jgi:hypothetical protein
MAGFDYCRVWYVEGSYTDANRFIIQEARKDHLSMFRIASNAAETAHYAIAFQDFGKPHPDTIKSYEALRRERQQAVLP